jgi:hypothetical protein
MKSVLLWSLILAARPALACKCAVLLPVCQEVAEDNVIFIGTVESVKPRFLNRWNLTNLPSLKELNLANDRYLEDPSPAHLAALQNAFRKTFPDLPEKDRQRLENATSQQSLAALFSTLLDHGKVTRFHVRTVFRDGDDDEDRKDNDKDDQDRAKDGTATKNDDQDRSPQSRILDVWAPFGECGYDFQEGETYLVYATHDEEMNDIETDGCTRTKRLSDAGSDLAYLSFYQDRKNPAGRLEGFATFDPLYELQLSAPHDPEQIRSPAPGLTIELRSDRGTRYTASDQYGRFVFDGLESGEYKVAVYAGGFPESIKLLTGPQEVHVNQRGCASQVLLVPKGAQ